MGGYDRLCDSLAGFASLQRIMAYVGLGPPWEIRDTNIRASDGETLRSGLTTGRSYVILSWTATASHINCYYVEQ